MKAKEIKAIECIQNHIHFYLAKLDSKTLKETCFISRTEDDPQEGFQRHLNHARAKDIANYLDAGNTSIPSPIILSAQKNSQIKYDGKKGILTFSIHPKSFLVIDGQHRVFGLFEAKNQIEIPIVIYKDLELSDEASLFIDINTNQKSVPASLLLAIKKLTGNENSIDEKQRKLYDFLNTNSPLAGQLSSTKSLSGKISRGALVEATTEVLKYGPIADKDFNLTSKVIKNYLEAFENIFISSKSQNAKLNKTLYFKAIFEVFNDCLTICLAQHNNLKMESLLHILEPLSKIDYDKFSGTSYKTQNLLVQEMKSELNKFDKITQDIL